LFCHKIYKLIYDYTSVADLEISVNGFLKSPHFNPLGNPRGGGGW